MGTFCFYGSLLLLLGTSWALSPEMMQAVENVIQSSSNRQVNTPISDRLKTLMQEETQTSFDVGFSEAGGGSVIAANSTQPTQFIVSGTVTTITRRPWQCLIEIDLNNTKNSFKNESNWFFICGCTVFSRRWVLTAAHCIVGLSDVFNYRVRSGVSDLSEDGGQVFRVIDAIPHPDYSPDCPRDGLCIPNDIGVLKLSRNVRFNRKTMPIRFATQRLLESPEIECLLSGFGSNGTGVTGALMEAVFPFHPNDICNCNLLFLGQNTIFEGHVCSLDPDEKVSACNGDSGGPYVCKRKGRRHYLLVGLTSFGFGENCIAFLPSVYTSVPFFCEWIKQTTGTPKRCAKKIHYY